MALDAPRRRRARPRAPIWSGHGPPRARGPPQGAERGDRPPPSRSPEAERPSRGDRLARGPPAPAHPHPRERARRGRARDRAPTRAGGRGPLASARTQPHPGIVGRAGGPAESSRRRNERASAGPIGSAQSNRPVEPRSDDMALSAEAEYVLRTIEERGIRFVRLWFTDVLGFLKAFTITSQELEGAFAEGMGFDGSSIDGFSRIEESDMVAVPDPSTFQLIPWKTEAQVARMFCDIAEPRRHAVRGRPAVRAQEAARSAPPTSASPSTSARSSSTSTSGASRTQSSSTRAATSTKHRSTSRPTGASRPSTYLESMGIPVEYVHHEVAPSQHEIDLRYTDALTMADNVMTYRLTVKEVAQEFGIYATFMPKPIAGRERQRHAHPPVAVHGRPQRVLRPHRREPPVETSRSRTSPASCATRRRSPSSRTSG